MAGKLSSRLTPEQAVWYFKIKGWEAKDIRKQAENLIEKTKGWKDRKAAQHEHHFWNEVLHWLPHVEEEFNQSSAWLTS